MHELYSLYFFCREEAKQTSDDVKHIPVFMEYNVLLELHDMENIHVSQWQLNCQEQLLYLTLNLKFEVMQSRLDAYCSQVSKNCKKEFKVGGRPFNMDYKC